MLQIHHYKTSVNWTGNRGAGTTGYASYDRSHVISVQGKPVILASSDPAFNGDPTRYNPEELLLASLSSCHMLWYLHLCSDNGIVVMEYADDACGKMMETKEGGKFTLVTLYPKVKVSDADMVAQAMALHEQAHRKCFIASSCNFPVRHEPMVEAV
ncbi:MAG: OsmC family peroxiredoxin [Chitinophagaceae bacterium]|nr:MAG: OsmC family peroxiredoxin [Chitinophagaceae bacterium]